MEVYRRLPPAGEAELIDSAVAPGSRVLELGCGAGRITHRLVALGHRVTAVDESAEMLAHVCGAETVHASIEGLALPTRFDAVVLASHFVNVPDGRQRAALLETCRRHVQADGAVFVERYAPDFDWLGSVGRTSRQEEVAVTLVRARLVGARVEAAVRYEVDGRSWTQEFAAALLSDDDLAAALSEARLRLERWLDPARAWLQARPCEDALR